jgi:outer membrane murein-binding lipoprotein Lpp
MNGMLLTGQVDNRDTQIQELQAENEQLRQTNLEIESELRRVKSENARAISALRAQLSPLFQALRAVFGQMDSISTDAAPEAAPKNAKWDVIKQRLTPRLREAIDILQVQSRMTRTQLAAAMRMDRSNCTKNVVAILLRQGLAVDDGQGISLKEL